MQKKNNKSEKLFYSIGEVASMFDVNTSLIDIGKLNLTLSNLKKTKKGIGFLLPKTLKTFILFGI